MRHDQADRSHGGLTRHSGKQLGSQAGSSKADRQADRQIGGWTARQTNKLADSHTGIRWADSRQPERLIDR